MILHDLRKIPKETLIIGHWSSKCHACDIGADYHEKTHETALGYNVDGVTGCGIEWKYVMPEYTGEEDMVAKMRKDLEVIKFDWRPAIYDVHSLPRT